LFIKQFKKIRFSIHHIDQSGMRHLNPRACQTQGTPALSLIDRVGCLRRQIFGLVSDLVLRAEIATIIVEEPYFEPDLQGAGNLDEVGRPARSRMGRGYASLRWPHPGTVVGSAVTTSG
jgi:hypothetical protein